MRALALAVCVLFGLAAPAAASITKDENGWLCGAPDAWDLAALRLDQNVVLNNFFFEESSSASTNMTVLKISYSVINRTATKYRMSSQFVGYDEASMVTFAMSVSPQFQFVDAGTGTSENDIYIDQPVLPRTAKICLAFAAGPM